MTATRLPPLLVLVLALTACGERRLTDATSRAARPPEAPAMDRPAPRSEDPASEDPAKGEPAAEAYDLTDEQWRARLTAQQYEITRRKGTERAFTGRYWDTKTPGSYRCVCCGLELFTSGTKYDSGCGWPSFTAPAEAEAVEETRDTSHGMVRTEITCRRCGAHLGHVFDDGPGPTGLRYCINSASLDLEAQDPEVPGSPDPERDADGDEGGAK